MTDERKSKITDATPEKVTPPRAFWRWPWHDWSVWEKCWMGARLAVRSLLAVAGLITAATLLVQFAPSAWERIVWRPAEYSMLSQLHAGYSIDYIKAKLGEPALVDSSPRIPDYRALTFVRRDYFVQAIVSESGRVEALTTVSCSPDFTPTFKAPGQKQIVLQAAPLAQAEQVDQDTSQSTANNPKEPE